MDCVSILVGTVLYIACPGPLTEIPRPENRLPEALTYHNTDIKSRITDEEYINIVTWAASCNNTIDRYEEYIRGRHDDDQHTPERD